MFNLNTIVHLTPYINNISHVFCSKCCLNLMFR